MKSKVWGHWPKNISAMKLLDNSTKIHECDLTLHDIIVAFVFLTV